jgi:general stress protein YciG
MKGVGNDMETQPRTKNRGFASMDAHRQREIARKGGRAAHEKGKAHEFTPDEARAAGRKGGEKVSVNRRHMAEIGRRGGRSSASRRRPTGGEGAMAGAEGAAAAREMRHVGGGHGGGQGGQGRQPMAQERPDSGDTMAVSHAQEAPTPSSENI